MTIKLIHKHLNVSKLIKNFFNIRLYTFTALRITNHKQQGLIEALMNP